MNLEFRASGVPLIGVLIANGKAQAVTGTKLGQLALPRCRHHPGRHGQRPGLHRSAPGVQAAGGRQLSQNAAKGPPMREGLFCCCAENAHIAKVVKK